MSDTKDLYIAGLGSVGRALLGLLASPEGAGFRVVALADSSGLLGAPEGFSPEELRAIAASKGEGRSLAAAAPSLAMAMAPATPRFRFEAGAGTPPPYDILVELGPTDARTGGPSLARCLAALRSGAALVAASKGPFVAGWEALVEAAGGPEAFSARARFSATVGAGTPVLALGRELARGSPIRGLAAVLNGTSSLVLALMEEGLGLDAAVREAQARGMAEADPSADLDGWDAAAKLCILAREVLGEALPLEGVARESVRAADPGRLAAARAAGRLTRAVGRLARGADGRLEAAVRLEELPAASPLAVAPGGAAVIFDAVYAGEVALTGRGAGPLQTASATLRDLRELGRGATLGS